MIHSLTELSSRINLHTSDTSGIVNTESLLPSGLMSDINATLPEDAPQPRIIVEAPTAMPTSSHLAPPGNYSMWLYEINLYLAQITSDYDPLPPITDQYNFLSPIVTNISYNDTTKKQIILRIKTALEQALQTYLTSNALGITLDLSNLGLKELPELPLCVRAERDAEAAQHKFSSFRHHVKILNLENNRFEGSIIHSISENYGNLECLRLRKNFSGIQRLPINPHGPVISHPSQQQLSRLPPLLSLRRLELPISWDTQQFMSTMLSVFTRLLREIGDRTKNLQVDGYSDGNGHDAPAPSISTKIEYNPNRNTYEQSVSMVR